MIKFIHLHFINIVTKTDRKKLVNLSSVKQHFRHASTPSKKFAKRGWTEKSCKMINEGRGRKRVNYFCEEGSFLLNFFIYWLCNLWGSQNGTRILRNTFKFGWWRSQKKAMVTKKAYFFKYENRNPFSFKLWAGLFL